MLDPTTDPTLRSWVESANQAATDFPIQNLPFGVFRPQAGTRERVGIAIGNCILDVTAAHARGLLSGGAAPAAEACGGLTLNPLMMLELTHRRALRSRVSHLLSVAATVPERDTVAACLCAQAGVEMLVPVAIGDYTDFYASVHHATNVGRMMRPDNPLLPNYKWVPIGYHGRASSIVVSGAEIRRPSGQVKQDTADRPLFGPSARLDFELEVGAYIGLGNARGTPIPIASAGDHIFGLCLVNDWSARDIQAWEYQPLGPFLAKSFATTVSAWVVTMDALAPFRTSREARQDGDPAPLPYLESEEDRAAGAFDIQVEMRLSSAQMRERGIAPVLVTRSNARHLYWTFAQLVAHHTSNGCNLRTGDLLASGTVSGPDEESRACLLERTWRGAHPFELPTGERRRFLEDGDEVLLTARACRPGLTIGFGECRGMVTGGAGTK